MLDNAGITNTTTQLEIVSPLAKKFNNLGTPLILIRTWQNIILNAFCLVCSLAGTYAVDAMGRKPTGAISTGLLTVFIFMIGALTKGASTLYFFPVFISRLT